MADWENELRTECNTLDVTDRKFWFEAYLKHTDVVVKTEEQSIAELAKHFDIRFVRQRQLGPARWNPCPPATAGGHPQAVDRLLRDTGAAARSRKGAQPEDR